MRTPTDPPPDQASLPADPELHPTIAVFPLPDLDGAEFGDKLGGHQRHRREATP